MSRSSARLIGISLLLAAALVVSSPLRRFLAVESCLDASGSYDYELGQCDFQNSHPYLSPVVPTYLILASGGVLALAGGLFLVFPRRTASETEMPSNTSLERTRDR